MAVWPAPRQFAWRARGGFLPPTLGFPFRALTKFFHARLREELEAGREQRGQEHGRGQDPLLQALTGQVQEANVGFLPGTDPRVSCPSWQ